MRRRRAPGGEAALFSCCEQQHRRQARCVKTRVAEPMATPLPKIQTSKTLATVVPCGECRASVDPQRCCRRHPSVCATAGKLCPKTPLKSVRNQSSLEYRRGAQALLAARRPTTSGQNQWHVAYVHLPKTGGSSIGAALAAGGAAACAHKTHNLKELGMCDCAHRDCLQKSQAAVVERPYSTLRTIVRASSRWQGHTVYVATIRSPRAWFYSAVGHWCVGAYGAADPDFAKEPPSCSNTTLMRASWFRRHSKKSCSRPAGDGSCRCVLPTVESFGVPAAPAAAAASASSTVSAARLGERGAKCDQADVKYYFAGANPQLAMLGRIAGKRTGRCARSRRCRRSRPWAARRAEPHARPLGARLGGRLRNVHRGLGRAALPARRRAVPRRRAQGCVARFADAVSLGSGRQPYACAVSASTTTDIG